MRSREAEQLDQRDKAVELFRTDMARLLAAVESVDAGCGRTFDEVCADAKAASEQLLARLRALTGEDWRTVASLFAYRYKSAGQGLSARPGDVQ